MKDFTYFVVMMVFTWLATASMAATGVLTFSLFLALTDEPLPSAVVGMGAALTMGTFAYPMAHDCIAWFEKWYRAK